MSRSNILPLRSSVSLRDHQLRRKVQEETLNKQVHRRRTRRNCARRNLSVTSYLFFRMVGSVPSFGERIGEASTMTRTNVQHLDTTLTRIDRNNHTARRLPRTTSKLERDRRMFRKRCDVRNGGNFVI